MNIFIISCKRYIDDIDEVGMWLISLSTPNGQNAIDVN